MDGIKIKPPCLKIEPEPDTIKTKILGHKRRYANIISNISDSPQTSHTLTNIIKPSYNNSLAVHLPPLNKKAKVTQNVTNNLFHRNNMNLNTNNNLDLDLLISQIANLSSINENQINILNELILSTANNRIHRIHTINAQNMCINNNNVVGVPVSNVDQQQQQEEEMQNRLHVKPILDVNRKSCHQCKTKKDVNILFYCTKKRPCSNNTFKQKRCRKKYCQSCMNKYYMNSDILQLESIKNNVDLWKWQCPACVGVCSCRACKRKRAQINDHERNRIEPTIAQNGIAFTVQNTQVNLPAFNANCNNVLSQQSLWRRR